MSFQGRITMCWRSRFTLLSRFAPRVGLVTLRQTFVRRCHGGANRLCWRYLAPRWRRLPVRNGSSFSSADHCERRRLVPAIFAVRVVPAHDEPRSGSNNIGRESTSGRSTNYGSEHLIRVFRDIGHIFSLPFLLSHPLPVGHSLRRKVQKRRKNSGFVNGKNGFNCVSCGTHRAAKRAAARGHCLRCARPQRKVVRTSVLRGGDGVRDQLRSKISPARAGGDSMACSELCRRRCATTSGSRTERTWNPETKWTQNHSAEQHDLFHRARRPRVRGQGDALSLEARETRPRPGHDRAQRVAEHVRV